MNDSDLCSYSLAGFVGLRAGSLQTQDGELEMAVGGRSMLDMKMLTISLLGSLWRDAYNSFEGG